MTAAAERLAEFNMVQDTYLSIFLALGGLGLILGTVGLGIVILRNVMERRSELALLRAVGFSRRALNRMVLSENFLLLALGVVCGTVSAIVAVLPALMSPGAGIPYVFLLVTLMAVVVSGGVWVVLATRVATRGDLVPALRNE
jgi:ABC-type antimicrobial peptide transport system permease subunit